jgi:hypothetical protein
VILAIVKTASAPLAKGDRHNTHLPHALGMLTSRETAVVGGREKSILTTHHPSRLDMDLTAETLRTGLTSADVFWRLETTYDATYLIRN